LHGGDKILDIDERLIREGPAICADWLGKTAVDLPHHMGVERYVEAEKAFADAIAPLGPQVQLFRFGVWHTPGISDIDLFCAVDDDIPTALVKRLEGAPRSELMVHPPMVLPRSIAGSLRWFLPATDIVPVNGTSTELAIDTPTAREFADLCLISSFDASLMAWRALRLARTKPHIHVRGSMLRLWAIRHTIEFAARAGLPVQPAWQVFADDCRAMRAAFAQGGAVNVVELSMALARAEVIARDVADKAALARIERSTARHLDATQIDGGRVRMQIEHPGWHVSSHSFGRRRAAPYLYVKLPPHVAAFVTQQGGDSPFDETLSKVRDLTAIRTSFIGRHDAYGLWSGKQFLGVNAYRLSSRLRDRIALGIISSLN
jgi:hypothetical protein